MSIRSISEVIQDFLGNLPDEDRVSIRQILDILHERGFGVLLFIFAAPMALPIPVPPGINILMASPLLLLTAQQAIGRRAVWMPEAIKKKTVSSQKLANVMSAVIPWTKKLEVLIKPRLGFMTQGGFSNIIGILGLIMALSVCVPVPLSNTVPSLGIVLMAVGTVMRDGLAVLAGALIGTLWVCAFTLIIIFLGAEGIDLAKETIKSYM